MNVPLLSLKWDDSHAASCNKSRAEALIQIMPYCPITKTTGLEWNEWPALDLSVRIITLNSANGTASSAISELKDALADQQTILGARAVSRTLLQCLKQVEKIGDGNSTQELQAAVLAHESYSAIMSGGFPLYSHCFILVHV
jgi:hypothetical protein